MAGSGSELLFIAVESNATTHSNAATHSEERAGKREVSVMKDSYYPEF